VTASGPSRSPGGPTYDAFADAPWLLGAVKSISYAVNMAAQREAARRGADDVIFLAWTASARSANLGGRVDGGHTMYTIPTGDNASSPARPSSDCSPCGRAGLADGDHRCPVDDLHAADGVFLAGTVRGAVDVVAIDGGRDHHETSIWYAPCRSSPVSDGTLSERRTPPTNALPGAFSGPYGCVTRGRRWSRVEYI